jgi:Ca2+-binding EF-hand superfamily protein
MGVLKRADVRRCLVALNLEVKRSELPEIFETLDPAESGYVRFEDFFAYAAILLNRREASPSEDLDEDEGDQDEYNDDDAEQRGHKRKGTSGKRAKEKEEIDYAFKLFTHQGEGPITVAHLRRVARELREEVPDEVLRDMILEANGGVGNEGVKKGVGRSDFEEVIKRAGVSFG